MTVNTQTRKTEISKAGRALIMLGVKTVGSYDPNEALPFVEEQMTIADAKIAWEFLGWVHANNKAFGHGNFDEVYSEFQNA